MKRFIPLLLLPLFAYAQDPLVLSRVHTNMVGFVQSTSLSAARTVLGTREHINFVKEYSPAADGITDDSAKLSAAMDAAVAGKKPLYIPAGTYAIQSQITKTGVDGLQIIGDGSRLTTITTTNFTALSDTTVVIGANTAFTTDLSSWTAGAGWAWYAGTAKHTPGSVETLTQSVSCLNNTFYRTLFQVVNRTNGTVTVAMNTGADESWIVSTNGIYGVGARKSTATTCTITITPSSDFDGSLEFVRAERAESVANSRLLWLTKPKNLLIADIGFSGNHPSGATILAPLSGIYLQGSTNASTNALTENVEFRNIYVTGFRGDFIEAKTKKGKRLVIADSTFFKTLQNTNTPQGATIQLGDFEDVHVVNNLFEDCGSVNPFSHAIYTSGGTMYGLKILGNSFLSKDRANNPEVLTGAYLWQNTDINLANDMYSQVIGNYFSGQRNFVYSSWSIVQNNLFDDAYVTINSRTTVDGNKFIYGALTTGDVPVSINAGTTKAVVRNNWAYSSSTSTTNAFYFTGYLGSDCTVENNVVEGMYLAAMINGATNVVIKNNKAQWAYGSNSSGSIGVDVAGGSASIIGNYIEVGTGRTLKTAGPTILERRGNRLNGTEGNLNTTSIATDTDKPLWVNATTTERASLDTDANIITGGAATFDTGTWTTGTEWTDGGAGTYGINSTTVGTHTLSFAGAAGTTKIGRRYSGSVTLTGACTITGTGTTLTLRLGGVTLGTFTTGSSSLSFTGIRLTAASSDTVQLVATVAAGGTVTATATAASVTIWAEGDVIDEQIVPATFGLERANEWYNYSASVLTANNSNTKRIRLFMGGTATALPVEIWTYVLPTSVAARANIRAQIFYMTSNTLRACVWYDDGTNQSTTWSGTITFPSTVTFATEHHICLLTDTDDAAADVTFSMSSISQNRRWNP